MKKRLFLFVLLCSAAGAFCQDDAPFNKVSVNVIKPLHFTYGSALDLLQQQVIKNALELKIKIKNEDVQMYAQSSVLGNSGLNDLLAVRLLNKTSPNAVLTGSTIGLSGAPALLFSQPRSLSGTKHYSFFYDLLLNSSDTIIPPGQYHFSLLFTLTAQ